MTELTVNISEIRILTIKPNEKIFKVVDDGSSYWKL